MNIAFIGTGIMGSPMALHLSKKHKVTVYNRTIEKAKKLEPFVKVVSTISEAVKDAEVVFTIVGYPKDVRNVYNEIFSAVKPGTICVDMTTSSPKLAKELFTEALNFDIDMIDAPVTGGDLGAKNATLTIMVGGKQATYDKIYPLLELMGSSITYVGPAGSGQYAKLSNQIAIAGNLLGVAESYAFAKGHQIDLQTVYEILNTGSAASTQLKVNGKKYIDNDLLPGFYVKHFLKDLELARSETTQKLIVLDHAITLLQSLVDDGKGDLGTQAIISKYIK